MWGLQDKKGRIRQGSPEEERALGQHITALAPSAKQLAEAGQLAELLTLLGMLNHKGLGGKVVSQQSMLSTRVCMTSGWVTALALSLILALALSTTLALHCHLGWCEWMQTHVLMWNIDMGYIIP